jgi:Sec-independent protein translocase protein TatA
VARSLGKAIVEFKKGMKGIEDDAERASEPPPRVSVREEERVPALPAASVATAPAPEPEPEKKPETPAGSGS